MRILALFCALMAVAVASPAQSDLIARVHFMGGQRISADPNSTAFTNEFCTAEARALQAQTIDKLSLVAHSWFNTNIPKGLDIGAA
jgi:hypothetical protein